MHRLYQMERDLHINRSEYRILSGGAMLLAGLRDNTADIDVMITEEAGERIRIEQFPINAKGLYILGDSIEGSATFDRWIHEVDVAFGFQIQPLREVLECKRRWNRPKDQDDIAVIEKYLNGGVT